MAVQRRVKSKALTTQSSLAGLFDDDDPPTVASAAVAVAPAVIHDAFANFDPFVEEEPPPAIEEPEAPPDLAETPPEPAGPAALTVGQLTQHVTQLLRGDVILSDVWVRGEISNLGRPGSGHLYFSLKDESACIACVMWRGDASRLPFRPESGMQVLAHGRVDVYAQRGAYQLVCEELQPDGLGAMYLALEQSKERLQAEGLLDPARKRPLPACPARVAIITSLGGAVVRDICVTLQREAFPPEILLVPALMQGAGAEKSVLAALTLANQASGADLIVLARGGGSIEDLWTFNSETLARAIAASRLPVISAVGHETDITLADFAADHRAPTPTAAAELIAMRRTDTLRRIERAVERAHATVANAIRQGRNRLQMLESRPVLRFPERLLEQPRQRLDDAISQAFREATRQTAERRNRLALAAGQLETLSPLATLARGYALVAREPEGDRLLSSAHVSPGETLTVRMSDGAFPVRVLDPSELLESSS